MEWMMNAFWAWIGWNILPPLFIILLFIVGAIIIAIIKGIRQSHCKHERWRENSQCHVICSNCDKDLGFIGTYMENKNEL